MNILSICIISLLSGAVLTTLKEQKSSIYSISSAIICVVLLVQTINTLRGQTLILNLFDNVSEFNKYSTVLLKVFGITLITETTSDLCKQMGENALSSKIDLVGRVEIIIISLPLVNEILDIINQML